MKNKDVDKWVIFYKDSSKILSKMNLTQREYRVIYYLVSLLNNDNKLLMMSQKDMADDLGMATSHISVAIKKLKERKIIVSPPGKRHLFLNSEIFQYGSKVSDFTHSSFKEDVNKKETNKTEKSKSNRDRNNKKEVIDNKIKDDEIFDENKIDDDFNKIVDAAEEIF